MRTSQRSEPAPAVSPCTLLLYSSRKRKTRMLANASCFGFQHVHFGCHGALSVGRWQLRAGEIAQSQLSRYSCNSGAGNKHYMVLTKRPQVDRDMIPFPPMMRNMKLGRWIRCWDHLAASFALTGNVNYCIEGLPCSALFGRTPWYDFPTSALESPRT